ncbi:hypothetical protein [Campylobacter sp. 19-13652]|uniref:hypothetical protein n=1 Tax=Campylobacter sp. 19-13652 TaxID=2840180 RepID=UPI001C766EFA|nr:hypothetical protein [Campylobacter sp. 19-13652]BCX79225.1 hypothetical protein LBC_06870 [Campylobacter sp. 19-13652]
MKTTTFLDFIMDGSFSYSHITLVERNDAKETEVYGFYDTLRNKNDPTRTDFVFRSGKSELLVLTDARVYFDKWLKDVAILELDGKEYLICAAVKNSKKFRNIKDKQ